jgi:predicted AAA+ superfamily ATPase
MIRRRLKDRLIQRIGQYPAVALLAPHQVGKTTLALDIAADRPSVYLDLEPPPDRARLSDPDRYLVDYADELVILDEVHRAPELFQILRGVIDRGRRSGQPMCRHGLASPDDGDALALVFAYPVAKRDGPEEERMDEGLKRLKRWAV